jgi:CheY-like chemotaxis protein
MTLLIADDNLVIRNLLKFYLQDIDDLDIKEVSNGIDALKIFSEIGIDIIMLDISMPELDGYNVANYLRAHASDTVIVSISSNLNSENRKIFRTLGVKYFLEKPINKKPLLDIINKIISDENQ